MAENTTYSNDDTNGDLLKPIDAYKKIYKDKVNQTANEKFDELKDKAEVNVEANRATIKEMNNLISERNKIANKQSSKSTLKVFLIILGVILIVAGIFLALLGINGDINMALGIVLGVLCLGIAIALFVVS